MVASRALLGIAALVSVVVVRSLEADSTGLNVFLTVWLLLPYVGLSFLLMARAPRATVLANCATTLLVAAGGLLFLVKVVFADPDPQGGVAVLLTPVYQGIATIVLVPLTRRLFGTR